MNITEMLTYTNNENFACPDFELVATLLRFQF